MPMHDTSCYGILIVARPAYYVEGGNFKTGNESNRAEEGWRRGRGEDNPHRLEGGAMAYYKVRIEVWCDWNPAESDLDDITQAMGVGEAICTMREVVAVVDRPQDIEDEEAMSFFGGSEGDADESQG
jgi:hypothetical protein